MDNTIEESCMQTDEVKDQSVDWRDNKSLAECAQHLSEVKVMSDVTFTFKKNGDRKLQAHKLILSMRSAVFEAMFYGPMAENKHEIDVEDVDPDIFVLVLGYIYTDKAKLDGETVLKCLYAARQYCLNGLVSLCSSFLENSISSSNVCTIYEQAKFFDVEELKNKCYKFLIENSDTVFQDEDVKKLSYESLLGIMDDEELKSNEILHFNMALLWAEAKCQSQNIEPSSENKREVLGEILGKIRFPVIPPEMFANEVIPTQILPGDEQISLFQFMVTRATKTPGHVGRFISLPRHNTSLKVDLRNVGSLGTYITAACIFKIRSNFDISLFSVTKFNFQSLNVSGNDGSSDFNVGPNSFDSLNGEQRVKNADSIVLHAGVEYQLYANLSRVSHRHQQPQTTIRKVNHTATFGEISIVFEEIPEIVKNITFYRALL